MHKIKAETFAVCACIVVGMTMAAPTNGRYVRVRLESDPAKLTPFFRHGYDLMRERMSEMKEYLAGTSAL